MENKYYRANLEDILRFSNGKRLLNKNDVATYTGVSYRVVVKLFEFNGNYISAASLAQQLSKGGDK